MDTPVHSVWLIAVYGVYTLASAAIMFIAARKILKLQVTFARCLLACMLYAIVFGLLMLLLRSIGAGNVVMQLAGLGLIPARAWLTGVLVTDSEGKPIGAKNGFLLVLLDFIGWALILVALVVLLVLFVIVRFLTGGMYFGASG